MGRILTPERREELAAKRREHPDWIGPQLGELVIEGGVPMKTVAEMLGAGRATAYRWLYGDHPIPSAEPQTLAKRLLMVLQRAKGDGHWPLKGTPRERTAGLIELVRRYRPAPRAH